MIIGNKKQEHFLVIYLNTKNYIIGYKILYVGTINASLVDPKEIYKEAILKSANKIIVAHNHPSGDTAPSNADIEVTEKIKKIGHLMNIELIDHLIVSNRGFYSFSRQNLL